jgi:nucleotide-binding universal stress UspA family protein
MRILLAVDGSTFSDAAVEEVARRPWPRGSEIKVLTVAERPPAFATEAWGLPVDYLEKAEEEARQQAIATTHKAVARIGSGVKVLSEVLNGLPINAILDEAERWNADLIVMGSHGRRGLTRLMMGSVSQAVASHAPCSVEIVRKPVAA